MAKKQIDQRELRKMITAWALVFDGGNGSFLAPVDGIGSFDVSIAETWRLALFLLKRLLQPPVSIDLRPRVLSAELLIRQVCELVESQPVRWVLLAVRVYVPQIFFEDKEPAFLLRDHAAVVLLPVLLLPFLEQPKHAWLGAQILRCISKDWWPLLLLRSSALGVNRCQKARHR